MTIRITVWSKQRGYRILKQNVTLQQYQSKIPDAVEITAKKPTIPQMEHWISNGVAKAVDNCKVEPDGYCSHNLPSWLLALNIL